SRTAPARASSARFSLPLGCDQSSYLGRWTRAISRPSPPGAEEAAERRHSTHPAARIGAPAAPPAAPFGVPPPPRAAPFGMASGIPVAPLEARRPGAA